MTVKLTSPAYGLAAGSNFTGAAAEEAWLMENGYATATSPNPLYSGIDNTSVVATQDPTLAVNREDPIDPLVRGRHVSDAYQFGTDTASAARVRSVKTQNPDLSVSALPAAGGTVLLVDGDNFTGATGVTVGGTAGTSFSVTDDNTVKFTSPAKAAGTYDLVVTKGAGNGTKVGAVTYV